MTDPVRDRLTVLASEKNVSGYERLADAVDGDAYYWSSVNPDTYPGYDAKLAGMAQAVHDHDGHLDRARGAGLRRTQIGGTTTVPRKNGRTLLEECAAAYSSSPDAIGLISWNEFSENSYLEPSVHYGTRYLDVAAKCNAAGAREISDAVSDKSDNTDSSSPGRGLATGLFVAPSRSRAWSSCSCRRAAEPRARDRRRPPRGVMRPRPRLWGFVCATRRIAAVSRVPSAHLRTCRAPKAPPRDGAVRHATREVDDVRLVGLDQARDALGPVERRAHEHAAPAPPAIAPPMIWRSIDADPHRST